MQKVFLGIRKHNQVMQLPPPEAYNYKEPNRSQASLYAEMVHIS